MSPTKPDPWPRRVQALIAKAESTEFPEEAEALLAKAQELMTRYAIDEALLAAGRDTPDEVVTEVIVVPGPYARAKAMLLWSVASANRCRGVQSSFDGSARCVLVGFRSDITAATTLFAALSMHGARAMLAASAPASEPLRTFRHGFLLGYASHIGRRLREAAENARRSVEADRGAGVTRVALVLAERGDQVDRAFEAAFPSARRGRPATSSSCAGAVAGWAAAERADIGATRLRPGPLGLEAR